MPFANIAKANDILSAVSDAQDIVTQQKNPAVFLQDYIKNSLPDLLIETAAKVAGRDDGSGLLTKAVLDTGTDKNLLGGIFQR